MTTPATAYVGLGSNLGDRAATFASAIGALAASSGIDVVAVSSVIETAPVGDQDQPPFLNAAISVRTTLTPRALLTSCQSIELAHGRDRAVERRWGPRTLDLDVLLYQAVVVDEPGLRIPHPHLHERLFALGPLAEIAPEAVHPGFGCSVESLRRELEERAEDLRAGT